MNASLMKEVTIFLKTALCGSRRHSRHMSQSLFHQTTLHTQDHLLPCLLILKEPLPTDLSGHYLVQRPHFHAWNNTHTLTVSHLRFPCSVELPSWFPIHTILALTFCNCLVPWRKVSLSARPSGADPMVMVRSQYLWSISSSGLPSGSTICLLMFC